MRTLLSIGSFSKIANVTTKTLRYYDEIDLLKPALTDSDTGYRYYEVSQLEEVLLINRLKTYGFTLDEIASVLCDPSNNTFILFLIAQKKKDLEAQVSEYAYALKQLNTDIATLKKGERLMSYLDAIEVKLTETKPMNILSIRDTTDTDGYARLMGKLYERITKEKLTPVGAPFSIYHDKEFNPENFDVEIAIPLKEAVTGTRDFPAYLCASVTLTGPYSEIPSGYTKISEWIKKEGYHIAAPAFEVYITNPHETPLDEQITEIYVPIKK